jgi:hypothetical protein
MMSNNNIKYEIAKSMLELDVDHILFIDLFVEQHLPKIIGEARAPDARSWGQKLLQTFQPKATKVSAQYNINPKFQEIIYSLNSIEEILDNGINSSFDGNWSDETAAKQAFQELKRIINNINQNSKTITDIGSKIQHAMTSKVFSKSSTVNFKGFDNQLLKGFSKLTNIRQIEQWLDNIIRSNKKRTRDQIIMMADAVNTSSPKYDDANTAVTEINKHYPAELTSLKNKIQQFSNNGSVDPSNLPALSDKVLVYLLDKTNIPAKLSAGLDPDVLSGLENVNSLKELFQFWNQLDAREKTLFKTEALGVPAADPSLANAQSLLDKSINTKFGDGLKDLKTKLSTNTTRGERYLLYLLSKTPMVNTILKGGVEAYGGTNPMEYIKTPDDIGNYFKNLNQEQQNVVEILASQADVSKNPMKAGKKAFEDIEKNSKNILYKSIRTINIYTGKTALTEKVISFILGQTDLIHTWDEVKDQYEMYDTASPGTIDRNQGGWNEDMYNFFKKNQNNVNAIYKALFDLAVGNSVPAAAPRKRSTTAPIP